jgi:hypothetical protein
MKFNSIPKFVVNLERRPDRLESIVKEMEYIGWDYEHFKAVDTNSHVGCTRSHTTLIKEAKEKGYESILVIEDDCVIMPYAKSLIKQIEEIGEFEWGVFNLAPTLARPVNRSEKYPLLIDLTNLPPAKEHERGIFATNMIMYHHSIYDRVLEMTEPWKEGYYAIDDYIYREIMSKHQSYCPILPIGPQQSGWSDVSGGNYNNYYAQTYNWNLYSPVKVPNNCYDFNSMSQLKKSNQHIEYTYES